MSPKKPSNAKASLDRLQSPSKAVQPTRTAAPPLHRSTTVPAKVKPKASEALSGMPGGGVKSVASTPRKPGPARPPPQNATRPSSKLDPPRKFYAVDLQPRRRRAINEESLAKRLETNKGKPFRNFQHREAARKKLREGQAIPPPPVRPTPVDTVVQSIEPAQEHLSAPNNDSTITTENTEPKQDTIMEVENDATRLFFSSDSEDEVKTENNRNDDDDATLKTVMAERRPSKRMSTEPLPQLAGSANDRHQPTSSTTQRYQGPPAPAHAQRPKLAISTQGNASTSTVTPLNTAVGSSTPQGPAAQISASIVGNDTVSGSRLETAVQPPRRRRSSLFGQQLPSNLRPNSAEPNSTYTTPVQRAAELVRSPKANASVSRFAYAPPSDLSQQGIVRPGQNIVLRDNQMTRELVKGDLLCHMIYCANWIGAVKLMHVKFEYTRMIRFSRPENEKDKKLLLHFDDEMSRMQYNRRCAAGKWFVYYDIGTLEAFQDSSVHFTELATHLEQTGTAAAWYHPTENFMGLLYPCRSPDWQDFGSKPGRLLEERLCIAFRQKLNSVPPESPSEIRSVTSVAPSEQIVDPRRRSIPTTVTPTRHSGVMDPRPIVRRRASSAVTSAPHPTFQPTTQDVPMTMTPNLVDDDAMDVDEPPEGSTQLHGPDRPQVLAPLVQKPLSSFPGIDRSLEHLSSVPKADAENRQVNMLLAYKGDQAYYAQQVKDWLITSGHPWERIFDMNNETDSTKFSSTLTQYTWVVLFDERYRIDHFRKIGEYVNQSDYILCWQFDYQASIPSELGTRKLYPMGFAICISESCYIYEPRHSQAVLKWFKGYVQKSYASCVLVVPPKIITVLLNEASLADKEADKKILTDLAILTQKLIGIGTPSICEAPATPEPGEPNLRSLEVIETDWAAVYKHIPEQRPVSLADIARQNTDKEGRLNGWFAAWALMNLHRHRKFVALRALSSTTVGNMEHIWQVKIAQYVMRLPNYLSGTKLQERGRKETREEEGIRSRSVSRGSIAFQTPGRSPAVRY